MSALPPGAPDAAAAEDAAWQDFVRALGAHLAGQWPELQQRLGDRYDAFVELAVQQAGKRGITRAAAVGRYVNLWFVWGPAYHDKPGFEWAQGILAAPPGREWSVVHQLVRRSLVELQRLPGARIEPQLLALADERVVDRFGDLGSQGAMRRPEPAPAPRKACDLEAAELRVLADAPDQAYALDAGGDWQRVPVALPPPLRVDAAHPLPALLGVLSHHAGHGAQATVQARLRAHAVCDVDVHPAVGFGGTHGRWAWAGHQTRAVSWPVATREQPLPRTGPGTAIAEETSPELYRLDLECCGLRDEGDPLGPLRTMLSAWPAEQWWIEVQRALPAQQAVLPGARAWTRGATRCRVERDGAGADAAPLKAQFEDGLDAAQAVGVQRLAAAWEALPGLSAARFDAVLGLLVGKAAWSWGWRLGPRGLDGPALMRLVGALEMEALNADLQLGGELAVAGTKSRVTLRAAGQAALRCQVRREAPEPPLLEAMQPAAVRWRLPLAFEIEPLAVDSGALLQADGAPTGALVGEAGLRPCTSGGSGWEWFAGLRIEAAAVPLAIADPLLGATRLVQPLLPDLVLVDWSVG